MRLFTILLACTTSLPALADDIATGLESARAAYADAIEKSQAKLLESFDAEIKKAAASGSLEAVKAIQQEKVAMEADPGYEPKATRLRPTMTRYRGEGKAARDKLKSSLVAAKAAYTKLLKVAEAEAVDAELKLLNETGKVATPKRPSTTDVPKATEPRPEDLKAGLGVLLFNRIDGQRDNDGFVEPGKLGKTISEEMAVVDSIQSWKYDADKNAILFGYLKISDPGEYEFRTYSHYDRNVLYVAGLLVCPYRGSVAGGSEPSGQERIALKKGLVTFASVGYVDARGSVDVTWKPPGQKEFSAIPKELLFHDPKQAKAE